MTTTKQQTQPERPRVVTVHLRPQTEKITIAAVATVADEGPPFMAAEVQLRTGIVIMIIFWVPLMLRINLRACFNPLTDRDWMKMSPIGDRIMKLTK